MKKKKKHYYLTKSTREDELMSNGNPPMMEERQRAKPRAKATWLVMQLQCCGSPRKTMEQRKVTTSEKRSENVNRASLAFTRGVPMCTINTTWKKKKDKINSA